MNLLSFQKYLPIHIEAFKEIEMQTKNCYFLKKKLYRDSQNHYYVIEEGYNNYVNLEKEKASRICELNTILSFFSENKKELKKMYFFVKNYENKKTYYGFILKKGNYQEIIYCLFNLFINEDYPKDKNEQIIFMNLFDTYFNWVINS